MSGFRVLVTGSRTWTDIDAIIDALECEHTAAGWAARPPVLVHGACPHGADDLAAAVAADGTRWDPPWTPDPHPADWRGPCRPTCRPGHRRGGICPAAGLYRNADMVVAGADVCLAFIRGGSRGATHCAGLARAAGIRTVTFTA